jgi:hypothetical protein
VFFLCVGLGIIILSGGVSPTIGSLSNSITATGFTFFGIGIAIGSFYLSEKNQQELLNAINTRK